jgi:uncharacterized protein YbaA (DUF1428 family)
MTESKVITRQEKYRLANKDSVNLTKLIGRIKTGSIPTQKTMEKYNITIADVNIWRAMKDLDPITKDPVLEIPRAKAILARTKQIDREIKAVNEIEQAANDLTEAKETAIIAAIKANNNKLATIQNMDYTKLSLDDVITYFQSLAISNPQLRSPQTVEKYMSQLKFIFREIAKCPEKNTDKSATPIGNIIPCITANLIAKLKERYKNPGTLNNYLVALSILTREYPNLQSKIPKAVYD